MPRGDRTGPLGQGPATGRGLGGCKPINQGGVDRNFPAGGFGPGRGRGAGRGLGRGAGRGFGRFQNQV